MGDSTHTIESQPINAVEPTVDVSFSVKKGDTEIEFNGTQKISGGLIYNGVKIAPVIPAGAKVGDTITWKVVQ